jgi:uncharacterized protein
MTVRRTSHSLSAPGSARVSGKITALALSLAVLATAGCEGGGSDRFMSIGTGGTGGAYYPLGGVLASRLSARDPGRQYTAEVTGGSVENANRLREGQIDFAFILPLTAIEAYEGSGDYATPDPGLRAIAPTYPNVTHLVVRGNSTAQSLGDLRGARISVGSPGSGTEQLARQHLEVYGMTYDDVSVRYLSFTESASALADGSIDAAIISVGYPAASVLEATTTGSARLVGMEAERVDALRRTYPYYSNFTIPGGIYRGTDTPVETSGLVTWIVGRADLPDEVVTAILDILADEREALERVHPIAAQIDMSLLSSPPIPLHDAALRWIEDRNWGAEPAAPVEVAPEGEEAPESPEPGGSL